MMPISAQMPCFSQACMAQNATMTAQTSATPARTHLLEFEASTDSKIDFSVLTLLPCLPWTRLDSFMRAREFCLGVAACVPAATVTVCGNALLGPPRPSLTMSKLQRTSNDQSASHSMLISPLVDEGVARPHTALSSSINLGS